MNPVHVPPTSKRLYRGKARVARAANLPAVAPQPFDVAAWTAIVIVFACFVASAWGA